MTMLTSKFLYLLLCILSSKFAKSECPFNCEPYGKCESGSVNLYCKCESGYAGSDCSFPYETCDDGFTKCYNGAKCTRSVSFKDPDDHDGRGEEFECDCSEMPQASPFQIEQCEDPIDDICEIGKDISDHAFCTNSGKCLRMIEEGERHPGCECNKNYEGRHCQYRKGYAPAAELALVQEDLQNAKNGVKRHSSGNVVFVVLLVLSIFGAFWFAVFKRLKQLSEARKAAVIEEHLDDLNLEMEESPEIKVEKGEMA